MLESKKSIKKNYIYNLLYQIVVLIVPIIVTPYISRVLGPSGIGQYSFSNSIISYFVLLAGLGFNYYAQREIARYQGDEQNQSFIFWEIFLCRLIPVGISVLINTILISARIYGDNTLILLIMTMNILAIGISPIFYFQGNENFGKIVFRNILVKIIGTVLIFCLVKNQSHVWLYTVINSGMLLVSELVLWPSLVGKIKLVKLSEVKPLKHLPKVISLFLPNIATSIYVTLDKSLIGIITQSNSENGYYEQAEKIAKLALTVITCLGTVMIPRNTNEFNKGNIESVKKNIYNSMHYVWLIGIPLMFGIVFVAYNLVPWFLGEDFLPSILLLQILSTLIVVIGISNVLGLQYLIPAKQDKKFTIALTSGAIINLILNIPFIYLFNSVGAAIATVLSEIMVSAIMIFFVRKELSIKEMFKSIFKPIIGAMIMSIILLLLSMWLIPNILNTMLLAVVGIFIYGVVIILLKDSFVIAVVKKCYKHLGVS